MANILYNSNLRISGPWLIEYKDLVELDKIVDEQWQKWMIINEDKISKRIDEELLLYPNTDKAALKTRIKDWFDYQYSRRLVIKFKNGNSLIAHNFEEAAKEPAIKNEIAIEFQWTLMINRFNVDISLNKYFEDLTVSISPDDHEFAKDFIFIISGWIEEIKPKKYLQKMKAWKGVQWFSLMSFVVFSLLSSNKDEYNQVLNAKAAELLKDGINSTEISEAIRILLEKSTGYLPEKYINNQSIFVDKRFIIFLVLLLISVLLSFIPKNNIGIGKGVEIVRKWKNYIKVLFITIPGSILLPILIDRLVRII